MTEKWRPNVYKLFPWDADTLLPMDARIEEWINQQLPNPVDGMPSIFPCGEHGILVEINFIAAVHVEEE